MTTPGGAKDELRRTLLGLRNAAGLSTREVGAKASWSASKVSRLESGRNLPNHQDVNLLARIYDADEETTARLEALADELKTWSRRVYLNRFNSEAQNRLKKIEADSRVVRTFSPAVIPGLLQTRDYTRAIFTAHGSKPRTPQKLEADLDSRMGRKLLLDEPGKEFVQVFTEGVLGWAAGPPATMVAQLEFISNLNKPGLRIGIIPFGAEAKVFPLHTWDIYDDWGVAFGTVASTAFLTHRQDVDAYLGMFAQLEQVAVFDDEAREILQRTAQHYREMA